MKAGDNRKGETKMTKTFVLAIGLLLVPSITYAQDGRWKLGGDGTCYWDATDGGSNQCNGNPGRWKVGNGDCYWDGNDSGINQCLPPQQIQEVHQQLLEVAAGIEADCEDIPEDDPESKSRCNFMWTSVATVAASLVPNPYSNLLTGYTIYCASWEVVNWAYVELVNYYTPVDWSYAPQAVVVKMISVMMTFANTIFD
jgi:hypothetical protein